jgi:eukaryotic-like serine/threonine-protein kinase
MGLPPRYKPTGKSFNGGGMSQAIVCKDEHLERHVVIKWLQPGVDQGRLADEIAALSTIRSKHVVEIFDVIRNESGKIAGIVEDYLPGDDLDKKLPIKDVHEFMRIAYAIACGISDVHECGHVHRDIKPNNTKFDVEGCLKLFDFGLSRPDDLDAWTIGTVGTPGYLAPELCVDDGEEVCFSRAVDVYAFGATAVKMMLGKLPADLKKLPPVLPCSEADFGAHPIGLPKEVSEVLKACLSANPNDRPAISEVRDVLALHLLRGKHRATLVMQSTVYHLDTNRPAVKISTGSLGVIQIGYDGLRFIVTDVSGIVTINNLPVTIGQKLRGAGIIIFGDPSLGWNRKYVSVDVSHPEVVL